ncbi:MAG: penicillin-binding protein 2, partial [Acidimicrobiia bacterium]|nr:penicillin-binding protein 2 [Acidimicrobiia bacterium]
MNAQIRRLALGIMVCYLVLFAQLNNVQIFGAERLRDNPDNNRAIVANYSRPRGTVSTADGVVVARSVEVDTDLQRKREFPEGELFAQVSGFYSFHYGASGVEETYDDELAGETSDLELRSLSDLFVDRDRSGSVVLTLRSDVQRAARDALGEREGSVVALDVETGEVLAMWSWPSYDPNVVSDPDRDTASNARSLYLLDDRDPMLGRAYQERYFPGSTFKVVTAIAGLESGLVTRDSPVYEAVSEWTPPLTTRPIRNNGATCGGTLIDILKVSCNTAFAEMGALTIGPTRLIAGAEQVGFNDTPPIDLPNPARSVFPTDYGVPLRTAESQSLDPDAPGTVFEDTPSLALASIGGFDVAATPLQMALVAAGVANNGQIPSPHVVREIRDADGGLVREIEPEPWRRGMSPATAATMREAMLAVVAGGTARGLAIPGWEVGGKTGTARVTEEPAQSHAWIVGFAGPEGGAPRIAVAVVVLAQPGASETGGGRVAAPIARA